MSVKPRQFRNRNEELDDMIALYNILAKFVPTSTQKEVGVVKDFLRAQIELFSTNIIKGMMTYKLVDGEFCYKVYKFNQQLFEEIIRNAIDEFYAKFGFTDTLNIFPCCCKTFLQAIMMYEKILQIINDDINYKTALSEKLDEMRAMSSYDNLPSDQKGRVTQMLKDLRSPN